MKFKTAVDRRYHKVSKKTALVAILFDDVHVMKNLSTYGR